MMTTDKQRQGDGASRLTPLQLRIRDKLGNAPKRYRRSIDAFHVALGRPPLWGDTVTDKRRK
jgi:hypothetical protein